MNGGLPRPHQEVRRKERVRSTTRPDSGDAEATATSTPVSTSPDATAVAAQRITARDGAPRRGRGARSRRRTSQPVQRTRRTLSACSPLLVVTSNARRGSPRQPATDPQGQPAPRQSPRQWRPSGDRRMKTNRLPFSVETTSPPLNRPQPLRGRERQGGGGESRVAGPPPGKIAPGTVGIGHRHRLVARSAAPGWGCSHSYRRPATGSARRPCRCRARSRTPGRSLAAPTASCGLRCPIV